MYVRRSVSTNGKNAIIKLETVRTVFSLNTHLLSINEPACSIDVVYAVASDQTPHSIGQAINHTLLPCLHLRPVKGDRFGGDTHCCQFFRACLGIAFGCREQCFEGNTAPLQAGATWRPLIDERDMMAKLRGPDGGHITTWARTQYQDIYSSGDISNYHVTTSFYSSPLHHVQHQLLRVLHQFFETRQELAGHGTVNQPVVKRECHRHHGPHNDGSLLHNRLLL